MANNYPTLMDVARRSGRAEISKPVEILNQANPYIEDIPWIECNSGVTHLTTIRTGIPKPAWRMLNSGVPNVKSTTAQIKAGCGMLEAYSEIDESQVELARKNGGEDGVYDYLASENAPIIEGFGQTLADALIYSDGSDPKKPVGLVNYYNKLPSKTKETNVIDGGGTGNANTSIWLVQWGPDSIHGIYPQGSFSGFREKYLGVHTVQDIEGNQFQAHRTHYKWDAGFVVRDWRCGVRIANIDVDAAVANSESAANLLDLLTRATYKLPNKPGSTRSVIYLRKEILTLLDLQCQNKTNLMLSYQDVFGKRVLTFRGIPLREQETLKIDEARVTKTA